MKIKEHEEMMRYLTRPKVNSDGAFKREVMVGFILKWDLWCLQ